MQHNVYRLFSIKGKKTVTVCIMVYIIIYSMTHFLENVYCRSWKTFNSATSASDSVLLYVLF